MNTTNAPAGPSRRRLITTLAATAALTVGAAALHGRATAAPPPSKKEQPMKTFAIIFHQGSKPLGDADLKKRFEEVRAWAVHQNAAGHKLEPHILAPEGIAIGPDGADLPPSAPNAPGSISAVLFLEARDLREAADVARAHPGLHYGASVEVRPWAAPPPPPAAHP